MIVDIELSADIRKAALTDSIDDTLNYKRVAKRVLSLVEASQFHLVETLAEHIAMLMLEEFGIAWVGIVLSKPGAVRSYATWASRWSAIAPVSTNGAPHRAAPVRSIS